MKPLSIVWLVICAALGACSQPENQQFKEIQGQLQTLTTEMLRLQEQVEKLTTQNHNNPPAKAVTQLDIDVSAYLTRLGHKDAEYVIVEFMDYQCPYCLRHAKQVLPELKRKYVDSGLVQYVVHDFPLEFHAQAENAALAARCAARVGKFAQMHSQLIQQAKHLSNETYLEFAKRQSLDTDAFSQCYKDKNERQHIRQGIKAALQMGVSGTPKFVLGKIEGKRLIDVQVLSGAQPIEAFNNALQQLFIQQKNKDKG